MPRPRGPNYRGPRYRNAPSGVERAPAVERFGKRLTASMAQQGMTDAALAAKIGCAISSVGPWRYGVRRPSFQTLHRIADALADAALVDILLATYRRVCTGCGRRFITGASSRPNGYCTKRCRQTHAKRVQRRTRKINRATIERERDDLRLAWDAMCRACEPDGACRDAECPGQRYGVSPLPLIQLRDRRSVA